MPTRAYSLLEIKSVDAERRVIAGVATTPSPDRMGDVIEPLGVTFKNPLPLLLFHDTRQPVGQTKFKKPTTDGIEFEATIATIDEPGTLKSRTDEAWQSIKAGLIQGVSIGFRPIEMSFMDSGGVHFLETEVVELSLVTIPANAQASIHTIKSIDQAAMGQNSPGDSGLRVVKALKDAAPMTIAEQITQWNNSRAPKKERMDALMSEAATKGVTLDQAQAEEYDTLRDEIKAIDAHVERLKSAESLNVSTATPITQTTTAPNPQTKASELRGGQVSVSVKSNLPKGTAFVRYACALAVCRGNRFEAAEYAKRWDDSTPEVSLAIKAAVNPGTTVEPAWAAPLVAVTPLANEFMELLRPKTLIGRIENLRRVPFNSSAGIQIGGGTYGFVGEGAPKPVGNLQMTSATLPIAKAAGIIVISQELARLSSPSAEMVVRNDMVKGMAELIDGKFIDPTNAGTSGVEPASITNAAVSIGSAGTSGANAETDFKNLVGSMVSANQNINGLVLIMSETNALNLSLARTTNGEFMFPNLSINGGSIGGVPVITSQKAGTTVALVSPQDILLADDGGVNIDISTEAAVEMNTTPTSPVTGSVTLVSLWQNNLIGLRAERFINWKRARLAGVRYTTATYV